MVGLCATLALGMGLSALARSTDRTPIGFVDDQGRPQPGAFVKPSSEPQHRPALRSVTDSPPPVTPAVLTPARTTDEPPAPVRTQKASSRTQKATARTQKASSITYQTMIVTAYCPCKICCGKHAKGITASGKNVRYNRGKFVAADIRLLPFGTRLTIPGYASNRPVEVIDKGGAIKGNKLDVFFKTHEQAKKWGKQELLVQIHD